MDRNQDETTNKRGRTSTKEKLSKAANDRKQATLTFVPDKNKNSVQVTSDVAITQNRNLQEELDTIEKDKKINTETIAKLRETNTKL